MNNVHKDPLPRFYVVAGFVLLIVSLMAALLYPQGMNWYYRSKGGAFQSSLGFQVSMVAGRQQALKIKALDSKSPFHIGGIRVGDIIYDERGYVFSDEVWLYSFLCHHRGQKVSVMYSSEEYFMNHYSYPSSTKELNKMQFIVPAE